METKDFLDAVSRVLGRCTLMGIALLLIWCLAVKLASPVIYQQGAWFGLTPHECDVVHYGGMGLLKLLVLLLFLFPYLAIRLVLRTRRG